MHLPTALLFFNVGIEVGQLAFIALLTLAGAMIQNQSSAVVTNCPVYLLGAVSTFWVLDRTGSLFDNLSGKLVLVTLYKRPLSDLFSVTRASQAASLSRDCPAT